MPAGLLRAPKSKSEGRIPFRGWRRADACDRRRRRPGSGAEVPGRGAQIEAAAAATKEAVDQAACVNGRYRHKLAASVLATGTPSWLQEVPGAFAGDFQQRGMEGDLGRGVDLVLALGQEHAPQGSGGAEAEHPDVRVLQP